MSEPMNQLAKTLRSAGQSLTRPRQIVFATLQDQEPQTMHQLVDACADTMDRASVYRTIAVFEQLGIVQRLQIGWKYKLELSDSFHHHHHHLTCLRCGAVTALHEDAQLEDRLREAARLHDFTMQGHQLEIRGLCSRCAATGAIA